jgi:hypothetical protein
MCQHNSYQFSVKKNILSVSPNVSVLFHEVHKVEEELLKPFHKNLYEFDTYVLVYIIPIL